MLNYDLVVVGGGPAGLAAAIEARKQGIESILVIERDRELGGILQQCIHNGFGLHMFKEELTGPEYAGRYIDMLKEANIDYVTDSMVLELTADRVVHAISTERGYMSIQAKAVILAMGCRERTAGSIMLPGYRPAGVFTAGTAQRYINMEGYMVGKRVVILGSGDIGLIMARRMTLEGAKVLAVAELMPYSGGLTRNIVQCLEDYDIPLYLSHTVTNIFGTDRLTGVEISKVDENRRVIEGTAIKYDCDTLLLSVGLIPENEVSKTAGVELDRRTSGPVVNEIMETSVEGVFACGNVVHVHDLVDFVSQESERAGRGATEYIKGDTVRGGKVVKMVNGNGVSYVVPQNVRLENLKGKLDLFFRVRSVYHKVELELKVDGKVIKTIKKNHMAPGEMEHILLKAKDIEALDGEVLELAVKEGQ